MNSKSAQNITLTSRFTSIVQDDLDKLPAIIKNIGTLNRFEIQNRENSQPGCDAGEKEAQELFAITDERPSLDWVRMAGRWGEVSAAAIERRISNKNAGFLAKVKALIKKFYEEISQ